MIGRTSFNTFRGTCRWHDYFDKFLSATREYLLYNTTEQVKFGLLMDENAAAFEAYKGNDGFLKLCDRLFLNDYLDLDGKVRDCFDIIYWWKPGLTLDEYKKAIISYLDFCETLIIRRGKRIIDVLSNRIEI